MRELVSLINITEYSDIEAVIDQVMEDQAQFNARRAAEYTSQSVQHDPLPEVSELDVPVEGQEL